MRETSDHKIISAQVTYLQEESTNQLHRLQSQHYIIWTDLCTSARNSGWTSNYNNLGCSARLKTSFEQLNPRDVSFALMQLNFTLIDLHQMLVVALEYDL